MLKFRDITLEDKEVLEDLLPLDPTFMSERAFVSLYLWGAYYKIKMCYQNETLYLCSDFYPDYLLFFPPFTRGDLKEAMRNIMEYAHEMREPVKFNTVSEYQRVLLEDTFGAESFCFTPNRASFDYIYNADDLMWLKGKKYSSKRNHINKFMGENEGDWTYSVMTPLEDYDEIIDFQKEWSASRGGQDDYTPETDAIDKALKAFDHLGLVGGIIRVKGKIIAFSIGKRLTEERFAVLFEKADAAVNGAYAMINQQFAQHNFAGVKYVNREEDLGIEGLRKAKESYYPAELTTKYIAEPLMFNTDIGVAAADREGN